MNLKMASVNNRKGNENNKSTGLILKLNPPAHRTLPPIPLCGTTGELNKQTDEMSFSPPPSLRATSPIVYSH